MPVASPTKPGTPRLSDVARMVRAPVGIVVTGWPAVESKCADLGIAFRWWQPPIGRLILAKRADGVYAATIGGAGLSIPRQVGKTFLVASIMFALCLLRPGFTVLWTAHRLKTAEETFGKLQVFAKRSKIKPFVQQITTGSGEQKIIFSNGSRILFGARERGFGRGFDEIDALVFDEAQHMTDSSLDDMVPATNQSRQPEGALMLFMGTPPRPQDPGEVFRRMRSDAAAGDGDTAWVEFGAEHDYTPTPLPEPLDDADWGQISTANPSFPEDTSRTAILRMRKKLGDDSFLREGLGIWDRAGTSGAIDAQVWSGLAASREQPESVTFALEIPSGRGSAVVGSAWSAGDGVHVEVAHAAAGTGWVLDWFIRNLPNGRTVVLDGGTEAASFEAGLLDAGLEVVKVNTPERSQACAALYDAAIQGTLSHDGDLLLADAVGAAVWKDVGEGARAFSRRKSSGDISRLYAVTLAHFGALSGADYDIYQSFY